MTELDSAWQAMDRARTLCDLGRYSDAVDAARRAIAIAPRDGTAWCLLAQGLLGLDDCAGALDAARTAAAQAPGEEWPHRLQSIALADLDRVDDAVRAALECVRCGPFVWQAHSQAAASLALAGRIPEAEAATRRTVELAPNEAQAWVIAAGVAAKTDGKVAKLRYRKALELDPQSADAHNGLARLRLRKITPNAAGLAAATTGFARAIRSDPHDQRHRRALDVVLHTFLARAAYFIFLVCYVAWRVSNSSSETSRLIPVILLVLPAIFAGRFVLRLERTVRMQLAQRLRRGFVCAAAAASAVAAVALIVGALAPARTRTGIIVASVILAIAARLFLFIDLRRSAPEAAEPLLRWRWLLWALFGGFALAGLLFLAMPIQTTAGWGAVLAGVLLLATAGGLAIALRRTRR